MTTEAEKEQAVEDATAIFDRDVEPLMSQIRDVVARAPSKETAIYLSVFVAGSACGTAAGYLSALSPELQNATRAEAFDGVMRLCREQFVAARDDSES